MTTGPSMYKCMERVVKGDAKAKFLQYVNLVGSGTIGNFTVVIVTMTMHIFAVMAYQDKKQYLYRNLRKPKTTKVCAFTTRLIQLNDYLP